MCAACAVYFRHDHAGRVSSASRKLFLGLIKLILRRPPMGENRKLREFQKGSKIIYLNAIAAQVHGGGMHRDGSTIEL